MGRTLKKFLGTGFSTMEESPLGQIINLLHKKLQDAQRVAQQDKEKEPSIQNTYTVKQLAVLTDILERIQSLLSYYSEGNEPSGLYLLPFGKKVIGLSILFSDAKDFVTAANAFYKEIQSNLSEAIKNSLNAQKVKQFTKDNIPDFIKQLKTELKKDWDSRFAEARKIPGFDLEKFYQEVDQAIDVCNFQSFTNGNSINSKELVTHLSQLIKKELFGAGKYVEYEFQISHQTTYEVIVEAIELLKLVPQNIDELITFLKPEIFTLNLRDGMLVKLIPDSYAHLKVSVEHKPSTISKYCYKITGSNGDSEIYDAKKLYNNYIGEVIGIFMSALTAYLKNYAHTPHVKSELARTQLIQDFITRERQLDIECFTARGNYPSLMDYQVPAETNSETKLKSLKKAIDAIDIHLAQITDLHRRKAAYEQKNFRDLVASHQDLSARLEELNTSYSALPLPDIIVAENKPSGKFAVVSVKEDLAIKVSALNELDADSQALLNKKAQLNEQCNGEVEVWKLHEIASHQDRNTKFLNQLQHLVQAGDELNQQEPDVNRSLEIDAQIDALREQLKNIAQQKLNLHGYFHEVQALQEQVNSSAKCPELLVEIDSTIRDAAVKCYEGSREQAKVCITKLQEIDRALLDREALLNNRLLKAQATKAFAETIKSSNTETIEKLREEKENQHAQLLAKQNELTVLSQEKEKLRQENVQAQYKGTDSLTSKDPLIRLKEEFFDVRAKLLARVVGAQDKILKLIPQEQIDLLFDKENFQSSAEVDASLIGVKKLLDSHRILLAMKDKNSLEMKANVQLLTALIVAKSCFDNNKEKIPFRTLDSQLQKLLKSPWGVKGFDHFLLLLADSEQTKSKWSANRKRKSTDMQLFNDTAVLYQLIKERIEICEKKKEELSAIEQINVNFQVVEADLVAIDDQLQILITLALSIEQMEEVRAIFAQQEKEIIREIEDINESLTTLEREQPVLKTSIDILNAIVVLLKGNQTLNEEQITDLRIYEIDYNTVNLLYENRTKITERINTAENKLKALEFLQDSLVKKVADFVDASDYQTNIKKIKTVLAESREKIANFVQGTCAKKLDDLNTRIKSSEEKLQTHLQNRKQFTEELNPPLAKQLVALNSLLAEYTVWSNEIKPSLERSNLLQIDLPNLSNQKLSEEIAEATQKVTKLSETSNVLQEELLGQISLLIHGFNTAIEVQQKRANFIFDESKKTYANNVEILNTVSRYLESFPSRELSNLQALLEKLKPDSNSALENLTAVIKARDLLQEQVTIKHSLNVKLVERIEAREAFAQRYNTEFDKYIEKRNQKYKYAFKDIFISSKDAEEREEFIDKLKVALTHYAESGDLEDSKQISACIKEKKGQFFGFNLPPILNRLLLDIKQLDNKIPKQYVKVEMENTDTVANYHVEALTKLEGLREANFDFAEGINLLYDKIISLEMYGQSLMTSDNKEHGKVAMELAAALQKQVDSFVVDNGEIFVGQDQFAKKSLFLDFQADFMCQLHSRDDVMSQHTSFWTPFLVNAGLLLATLGVAVGVKLLVSKLLTGHASFFYKPEGLKCIDAIHQVAEEGIAAPAA